MDDNTFDILKRLKLFQGLNIGDMKTVYGLAVITERAYSKNQIIVNQGDMVRRLGIIKKGAAISTKYHYNGDAQILRIYNKGEIFSLDAINTALQTSPVTLTSQTDSSIIFIGYADLFALKTIPSEVKKRILLNSSEILSNELIRLMYKVDVLSKRTLKERVLTYLSLISERTGTHTFEIDMNQEQLAQYLCVNRSVLSKELNQMRRTGLIDYKGTRFTLYQK